MISVLSLRSCLCIRFALFCAHCVEVQWHRVESQAGEFRRSFRMPRGVTTKHIKANSKYGVLEVCLS
jgi:hypothetical protein